MSNERLQLGLFRVAYLVLFAFLMAPLVIVIFTSFTEARYLTFPPEALTLQWYGEFLADSHWISAIMNSLVVGLGTMAVATTLGVAAALGVRDHDSRLTNGLMIVSVLPLFIPPVIIAVALLTFLSRFGLNQSYIGVIIAHSLWATPLVFFIMQAVFSRFNWDLHEAALDLGAGPYRTFFEIVLPEIKEGLLAAAIIAFIVSLQEFIMAMFLTGVDTRTIPVLAYTAIRQVLDPVVSVVSTVLVFGVLALLLVAVGSLGAERLARQL
ncbi:spermidine/putrescine ABC transporter permease component potC [Halodesulfurarchaeum formicicum]|uniref:Spermidine/putrescine ABC transporter permease component potC n=1 Tax=Halodesulfurarchaeum formicicum TaxID=1873524 RepID=A0A1D8S232_9EURY|nr:ABC transporter permease [Halodesulfurarchaeum formicicum]AOW79415.1 spermidine/putrescine ABC transporter permease component potC [Halodesulfurarchaeum formicicum]